ncbi:ribosomal protein S18-alanine N-acetyltransferase [Streptococcus phocae subsp. phocae]
MKNIQKQALGVFQVLSAVYEHSPWSLEQISADMQQDQVDYFTIYDQEQMIGFLAIQYLLGEIEITNIAVLPTYQGQGIASQLLKQLDSSLGPVFLEVRQSNEKAQRLYARHGFEIVGERKEYYHNPVETALIMKREGKNDR